MDVWVLAVEFLSNPNLEENYGLVEEMGLGTSLGLKMVEHMFQLIGLREKLQMHPMIFMGKSRVSGQDFPFN